MKKLIFIHTIIFSLVLGFANAQSKKMSSFSDGFDCLNNKDGSWGKSIKTDDNLKDYIEFKLCNPTNSSIVGVIFIYSTPGFPIREVGRYKIKILPNYTGKPRFYLPISLFKTDEYNTENVDIGIIIYSDGTRRKTMFYR